MLSVRCPTFPLPSPPSLALFEKQEFGKSFSLPSIRTVALSLSLSFFFVPLGDPPVTRVMTSTGPLVENDPRASLQHSVLFQVSYTISSPYMNRPPHSVFLKNKLKSCFNKSKPKNNKLIGLTLKTYFLNMFELMSNLNRLSLSGS